MGRSKPSILQGTLDMLILKSLAGGATHGYGVGQRIALLSEDVLRVEEGSLYPALYRLEDKGLIASEWGPSDNNRRARFYRLTAAGRKQLAEEASNWQRLSAAVTKVLETA